MMDDNLTVDAGLILLLEQVSGDQLEAHERPAQLRYAVLDS